MLTLTIVWVKSRVLFLESQRERSISVSSLACGRLLQCLLTKSPKSSLLGQFRSILVKNLPFFFCDIWWNGFLPEIALLGVQNKRRTFEKNSKAYMWKNSPCHESSCRICLPWKFANCTCRTRRQVYNFTYHAWMLWLTRFFCDILRSQIHGIVAHMIRIHFTHWWFEPLWKILVNWDDYSQYMGK